VRLLGSVMEHLRHAVLAYAVLLVALVLTLLAFYYVRENVEASARVRFEDTVQTSQEAIGRRLARYINVMFGVRGLFSASSEVTEEEWRGFVNSLDLQERYEGIQMMGYARAEGPGSYPITYAEPMDRANRGLVGYDPYLMAADRATMDRARDTGEVELTGKTFMLMEAPRGSLSDLVLQKGVIAYLPIYRKGEPRGSVAERRRALEGYVVSYLPTDRVLEGILNESYDSSVDIEVYDGAGLTPKNLLYDEDGIQRASEAQASSGSSGGTFAEVTELPAGRPDGRFSLGNSVPLDVEGREWSLYFETLPGFERGENTRLPLFVLLSGLGVSLLLFGVTYMLVRARLLAEEAGAGLEEANRELEVTNRELEAFSYSVSHDLRAPLRSIDGFSQILLEDYADELDEEGKDYLGRVRAASQRMGRLIDDLLGLSRVTRAALRREQVDLSSLAHEVADGLRESRPDRAVEFEIEDGIEVHGDPRLIRVALTNLLGNAFKFTEKEERARISFGEDRRLSHLGCVAVYYVRDNGAGFDMEYADKLFGAFQRLHGASEFEGTGIGLATVQRIVRRHGGRVWAEGRVGDGATFYFTLRPGLQIDPSRAQVREEAEAR
jgi:signal transduction histidine kinase